MKTILHIIEQEVTTAFVALGYEEKFGKVGISNRLDLCEYQCNGAMAAAKYYQKKPIDIANEVVESLKKSEIFEKIEAVMPGFININISSAFLGTYIKEMAHSEKFGIELDTKKKIIVDYGGANVAKPLHIGHLRSAVIGECLKRMGAFFGNDIIGDVHLGDWGLQMGLIIEELRLQKPDLVYFDETYTGKYPSEPPFTLEELEEMYPAASKRAKEDEAFKEAAHMATLRLQGGDRACTSIWKHIIAVSVADLKKNYAALDVTFDLWKGESDAAAYIPALIEDLEKREIAYLSEGALVVDIAMEGDSKELPPCMIRKSDGAALYTTSDLGTLVEREKLYNPDAYIYIADKRQELHYTQFFRVARIAGIVPDNHSLTYIGFGTMNGIDGKPFKTRDGGVMRLENLIADINTAVLEKMTTGREVDIEVARETAKIVGLAAIKYADLSNQATKDYIFDIDRFTSFEGNTGPYILYTIVRIGSILEKYYTSADATRIDFLNLSSPDSLVLKQLFLEISKFNDVMKGAWEELAPHRICQYIYAVANAFNSFYHEIKILSEVDVVKKHAYLAAILLTKEILNTCIGVLGMRAPSQM